MLQDPLFPSSNTSSVNSTNQIACTSGDETVLARKESSTPAASSGSLEWPSQLSENHVNDALNASSADERTSSTRSTAKRVHSNARPPPTQLGASHDEIDELVADPNNRYLFKILILFVCCLYYFSLLDTRTIFQNI